MKFYIDGDKDYPTICGTGTEDYFGGAWSFATQQNGQTFENQYCTPYLGYPYYSSHDTFLHNDYHNDDQMPQRSFYRWHLLDPILFEKDLKVTLQQIGVSHGGLFDVRMMSLPQLTGTRRILMYHSRHSCPEKSAGQDDF